MSGAKEEWEDRAQEWFEDAWGRDKAISFAKEMTEDCLRRCLMVCLEQRRFGESGRMQGMHEAIDRALVSKEIAQEIAALADRYGISAY